MQDLPADIRQQIAETDWTELLKQPAPPEEPWAVAELVDSSLISVDEFLRDYTDNGLLFHGTPTIGNVASILANNFRLTCRPDAGMGVYVTKMWETAEFFVFQRHHRGGAVLDLAIRPEILAMPLSEGGLRVLRWTAEREAELRSLSSADFLISAAQERRMPLWVQISRTFEPDIVVADGFGIVVTKPDILALPPSLSAVRESLDNRASRTSSKSQRRMADEFSRELFTGLLDVSSHRDNPVWRAESSRFVLAVLRELAGARNGTLGDDV